MKLPRILLLTLLLALPACSPQSDNAAVTTAEVHMFEHTKTYCFGRFLVKIPTEAKLENQWNEYYAKRIDIGRGKEEFQEKVKEMLEKRKNKTGKRGFKYVRSEYPEGGNDQIIIGKADLYGEDGYSMDVFAWRKGGYYFYFTDAGPYDAEWIEKNVAVYRDIALPNLRYRPDYDIPKEPGFCFKDGFIAGESKQGWSEESGLYFKLKDYPDVQIRVSSMVFFASEPGIVERFKAGEKESWWRVDSVKEREAAGTQGGEMLVYGTNPENGNTMHFYRFETFGELKNPLRPGIILEILTGEPVNGEDRSSSLTTPQVRALYETILNSIQFRPVTPVAETPPEAEAQPEPEAQTPLLPPKRLATGERCTKAGLWRCVEDGGELAFVEGQLMPTAAFDKPATGWLNRVKGVKREFSHMGLGHWEWVGEEPGTDGKEG